MSAYSRLAEERGYGGYKKVPNPIAISRRVIDVSSTGLEWKNQTREKRWRRSTESETPQAQSTTGPISINLCPALGTP